MPVRNIILSRPNFLSKAMVNLLVQLFLLLSIAFITAKLLTPTIWANYTGAAHTVFELTCIFISLAIFLLVWHTYERTPPINQIIGLGFLMVTVFEIFHTYYSRALHFYPPTYFDLGAKYWFLDRFTEALLFLFISIFKTDNLKINKWLGLAFALILSIGLSYFVLFYPALLPHLFTENDLTPARILLEYLVAFLFLVALYNLRDKVDNKDLLTYKYIILALLLSIPTQICFTLFCNVNSFYNVLGHVLKVISYYYLLRGIFVSSIVYPYEKLESISKFTTDILNGLPLGLITYDSPFHPSFANQKALELTGCNPKQVHLLITEELPKILGSSNPVKNQIIALQGCQQQQIKLRVDSQPLAEGGSLILFEEAKKEQELANLQLQTQTILNSINSLVVLTDRNNKIIMCNQAFQKAVETKYEDTLGLSLKEFYRSFFFKRIKSQFKPLDKNPTQTYQLSFITPEGVKKELIIHWSSIYNIEGEHIGGIAVGSDVTTLRAEQEKLQQQEKLSLLGQMTAGIVHEIKNPLTTIKGFSQLIISKTQEQQIKNYAQTIDNEVDDINKVVMDFLAFSKPQSPILKKIGINQLVQSMQLMLESHSFLKKVELNFNLMEEEKEILADEGQLKQVILNIVKNALDAMNNVANPFLNISSKFDSLTREISLIITDNGKGMSAKEKAKLGTPFFTTKEKGTGLGLSICYQIVKDHGGQIEIESQLGKGTSFIISLASVS